MPLTGKGQEILAHMKQEYGEKKGEEVFYASKNAGTVTGVDGTVYDWAEMWQEPVTTESPKEEKEVKTTGDGIKLGDIHRRLWGR